MDLVKVEFHIRDVCKASVTNSSLGVWDTADQEYTWVAKTVQFASYGTGKLIFKVTALKLSNDDAPEAKISFSLLKDSACPSLGSFLASNDYALFSTGNQCCPLNPLPVV